MEGLSWMDQSDVTARVSNYISKFLRDNFGKGPESVYTTINDMYITIYIRNFISPPEKVLLKKSVICRGNKGSCYVDINT